MPNTSLPLRGRPKDLNKRAAIIEAGRQLFALPGKAPVTVQQVLVKAGVSRGTFYANFVDTDSLLEAVVEKQCDYLIEGLFSEHPEIGELAALLRRFGTRLLTFLSSPEMMSFERRLTAEVDVRPGLARRFFAAGPARAHARLVDVVRAGVSNGELVPGDPVEYVGDLIGLWQGFQRLELAFGVIHPPSTSQVERQAARGVELFFKLYGSRWDPPTAIR